MKHAHVLRELQQYVEVFNNHFHDDCQVRIKNPHLLDKQVDDGESFFACFDLSSLRLGSISFFEPFKNANQLLMFGVYSGLIIYIKKTGKIACAESSGYTGTADAQELICADSFKCFVELIIIYIQQLTDTINGTLREDYYKRALQINTNLETQEFIRQLLE